MPHTTTDLHEILPFARVFLGDTKVPYAHTDDELLIVLQVTTAILKVLGYDRGHQSDGTEIRPLLSDVEMALWGNCVRALILDPEALRTGIEAVSVRTLGTAYSTEARARFVSAASTKAFVELRRMIRGLSDPFKSTTDNLDVDTLP